jgi:hypothetical protein
MEAPRYNCRRVEEEDVVGDSPFESEESYYSL